MIQTQVLDKRILELEARVAREAAAAKLGPVAARGAYKIHVYSSVRNAARCQTTAATGWNAQYVPPGKHAAAAEPTSAVPTTARQRAVPSSELLAGGFLTSADRRSTVATVQQGNAAAMVFPTSVAVRVPAG